MKKTYLILKFINFCLLGVIVLSVSPFIVGMLSVLLGNLLGCDFSYDTSTTVLCEPQVVRDAIEFGTMINWYALATLPIALIASIILAATFSAMLIFKALARR